jgi:hypothetical protein
VVGEIGVGERGRRQVDGQLRDARVGGGEPQRLGDHPAIDPAREAEALAERQEGTGGVNLAVGAAQPQQQLEAVDALVRADRGDRLRVQHEPVAGERAMEAVGEREVVLHPRRAAGVATVERDPVATASLAAYIAMSAAASSCSPVPVGVLGARDRRHWRRRAHLLPVIDRR